MADYIAAHSGYDVEIYPISSSNAAIEAVRFGHADAAFLDGGAGFVAWKSHSLEAILADTKSDGSTYYTAAAWVKNSSNITSLEQLEGQQFVPHGLAQIRWYVDAHGLHDWSRNG